MIWLALAWYLWQEPCAAVRGDMLVMECQSTGLVSAQEYRGPMTVEVDVKAYPIGATPAYWAGLALNGDVPGDTSYVQAAITQGIEPYTTLDAPHGVKLATTGADCCQVLGSAPSAAWHRLRVTYDGSAAHVCVNAECSATPWGASSYRIELLCVADNPATPNAGGRTRCEWRDMRFLSYLPGIAQP